MAVRLEYFFCKACKPGEPVLLIIPLSPPGDLDKVCSKSLHARSYFNERVYDAVVSLLYPRRTRVFPRLVSSARSIEIDHNSYHGYWMSASCKGFSRDLARDLWQKQPMLPVDTWRSQSPHPNCFARYSLLWFAIQCIVRTHDRLHCMGLPSSEDSRIRQNIDISKSARHGVHGALPH